VNGIEFIVKPFGGDVRTDTTVLQTRWGDAMIAFLAATVIRCRGGHSPAKRQLKQGSSQRMKKGGIPMEWVQPDFEEISLACEINSYAEATL
jgi:coenzyme PQQ precursor peptide PqqA